LNARPRAGTVVGMTTDEAERLGKRLGLLIGLVFCCWLFRDQLHALQRLLAR